MEPRDLNHLGLLDISGLPQHVHTLHLEDGTAFYVDELHEVIIVPCQMDGHTYHVAASFDAREMHPELLNLNVFQDMGKGFKKFGEKVKTGFQDLGKEVKQVGQKIKVGAEKFWDKNKGTIKKVVDKVADVVDKVAPVVDTVATALGQPEIAGAVEAVHAATSAAKLGVDLGIKDDPKKAAPKKPDATPKGNPGQTTPKGGKPGATPAKGG